MRNTPTCAASFWPKNARSGRTISNSLQTTVVTPRKCPGRELPSSLLLRSSTSTTVLAPDGYISATEGMKSKSTLKSSSNATSRSRVRGYLAKSSVGPNCNGLTKIDTAVTSHCDFDFRTSERCPSCKAPIVGTKPNFLPSCDALRHVAFIPMMVSICCMCSFLVISALEARPSEMRRSAKQRSRLEAPVPATSSYPRCA